MIGRLVTVALEHRRRVFVTAGVLFVIAATVGVPVAGMLGSTAKDFQSPGSQYERTNAAITAATGQNAFYNVAVLLRGARNVETSGAAQHAATALATLLAAQHGFQRVLDYPATPIPALVSRDRDQTVVLAAFASEADATTAVARVRAAV